MLKQRLITAAILIPIVVFAILKLPTNILQWCIAGITILAAWEWFSIIGLQVISQRSVSFITMFVAALCVWLYLPPEIVLLIASIVWLTAAALIIRYAHSALSEKMAGLFANKVFGLLVVIMVLIPFWISAMVLHQSSSLGPQQLLYVMVTVWLADTGGYFAGKRWGKQHLAKVISPNKTWQGVYGALALAGIWAIIAFLVGIHGDLSFFTWMILTFVTVMFSIAGDLFESLFKRSHQVKDSGNLLPGHGGILDRIDSLLAATPVFVAGLAVLGAL